MALYDQHMHTRFSVDSEADLAANAERAIELGLSGVSFTDHYDTHPIEWPICRYDYDALAGEVARLRERFGERLRIGLGIEICYQPEQMGDILAFLDAHHFDVVLLSVHWTCGRAMHMHEHWQDWSIGKATRLYLQTVLDAVRFVEELARQGRRPFQVLGHLDMVKRYTQRFKGGYDLSPCRDLIDEILTGCLEAGLIPEVNTSSLRQELPEPMPGEQVVRRYAELGGTTMSLGSDAHRPADIAAGFDTVAPMMRACGITDLAIFHERRMQLLPL